MYIKILSIYETSPEVKLIREIKFSNGVNFIVDAGIDQEKGNSVGKTTVLKLIDICLGASSKKYIYTDYEMGTENELLKDYIHKNKIQVKLVISEVIDQQYDTLDNILSVDLFNKGSKYIDGERIKATEYTKELNKIIFGNSNNVPTFRQLINMFVRIDQKTDETGFLKFLNMNTSYDIYENIYSYLFELKNQNISTRILELKSEIKAKDSDINNYKRINSFKSIDAIKQKIAVLENELISLTELLNVLIDSKHFKENEEKINQVKIEYAIINDNLDKFKFKQERIVDILENATLEKEDTVDMSILQQLYDESILAFKALEKTFEELVLFNNQLQTNKVNYFSKQLERITSKISETEKDREELFKQHSNVIMLIEENKLEEYTQLQEDIGSAREKLGSNKQVLIVYESLADHREKLNKKLERLQKENISESDNLTIFNKYFSEYTKVTNSEEYVLYKTEEGFPLAIQNVARGLSTGTKKSVIAAFDLAYQSFSEELGKKVPRFIVHDVIETMDKIALNGILNLVKKSECQYIVAVLKEKIESNSLIQTNDIKLTLSESERLFKM